MTDTKKPKKISTSRCEHTFNNRMLDCDVISLEDILNDCGLSYDTVFEAVASGKICPFYDFHADTIWFSTLEVTELLNRRHC